MQVKKENSSSESLVVKSSVFGKDAEEDACRYLRKKGYRILKRNYRCRRGEIDIIAAFKDIICFIEVKARTNLSFGLPPVFVTRQKQDKIKKTALFYITANKLNDVDCRFDVVSVIRNQKGFLEIELIEGAFD